MSIDHVRRLCLSFPHATENVQWGADLVFKISGKMFAVICLEPSAHALSFKCTDEVFAALTEQPGIAPAPYMARNKWVALESFDALPKREIDRLLRNSYDMVLEKLPKKVQAALDGGGAAKAAEASARGPAKAMKRAAKSKRGR